MSKQQGYQQLGTDDGDSGFAVRLPQAGGTHQTDGAYHGNFGTHCTCGAAGGAYPAATYAGAHLAGYPAGMPMTAPVPRPVGLVVQDPKGRCGKKRARRMACAANGCRGCQNCRGCHGCRRRRRGGRVHLLFGLARAAFHSAQDHHRSQPPAPADKPTSSSQ